MQKRKIPWEQFDESLIDTTFHFGLRVNMDLGKWSRTSQLDTPKISRDGGGEFEWEKSNSLLSNHANDDVPDSRRGNQRPKLLEERWLNDNKWDPESDTYPNDRQWWGEACTSGIVHHLIKGAYTVTKVFTLMWTPMWPVAVLVRTSSIVRLL
jgi:hypothetical protein